jgi:hypothetical protein
MKPVMISTNRVKALLKSYGGNPEAWPENERFAAQQCIVRSDMLKSLQNQALKLDQTLTDLFTKDQGAARDNDLTILSQRIVRQLPEQQTKSIKKQRASNFNRLWQHILYEQPVVPILLGSITLVLAVFLIPEQPMPTEAGFSLAEYNTLVLDDYLESKEIPQISEELELLTFLEPELLEE